MIGYLKGKIVESSAGRVLLGIGTLDSVVGYMVAIPATPAYESWGEGQTLELYVYTHVREDAFDLYGFASRMEKELFTILLSVNGIGPKSALGILSKVESETLIDAIVRGDQALLTQIPGIGKKTAERVVVELRDSIRKKLDGLAIPKGMGNSASQSGTSVARAKDPQRAMIQDAREALLGLGYRENQIEELLRKAFEQGENHPKRLEDLVRIALRQLQ